MKTVYIKLTNECQLICKHCYNSACGHPEGMMSLQTLDMVKIKLLNLIKKGEKLMISFHGGEPMLFCPTSSEGFIISDFIRYFKEHYPEHVDFSMTTNLVYTIKNYHIDIFRRFGTNEEGQPIISTSWDYDIRFSTKGQGDLWYKNVMNLIDAGFDVRPIITVTTPLICNKMPIEIMTYMKALGVTTLNFERITRTGRAEENSELIPTNTDMRKWLSNAYEVSKTLDMRIPLFENLERAVKFGEHIGCRARQCTKDVITINPDGSVATCPNIANEIVGSLAPVITSDIKPTDIKQGELYQKEQLRHNECYLCEHFSVCNGDCFQLEWDETGCPGLPEIITYMKEVL